MADTSFANSFLNDIEKDAVRSVADNPTVFEALKKVVLADAYFKGTMHPGIPANPTRNAAIAFAFLPGNENKTDEQIGAETRAFAEAVRLVEGGFQRVEAFKTVKAAPQGGKPSGR